MTNETGKIRSSRVPLDYYRRRVGPAFWKPVFASFGAISSLCVCIMLLRASFSPAPAVQDVAFNHGPLSQAHKNVACQECHTDYSPISPASAFYSTASMKQANIRCNSCHFTSAFADASQRGNVTFNIASDRALEEARNEDANDLGNNTHHWHVMKTDDAQSCLDCHVEHQGDVPQTQIADSECLNCHANLENVMVSLTDDHSVGSGQHFRDSGVEQLISFADHPPFRNMRPGSTDSGTIKFNHVLHMTAGLVRPGESGAKAWDADRLSDGHEFETIESDGRDLIKLSCQDCHEMANSGEQLLNPMPIEYDKHCSVCHMLTPASMLGIQPSESAEAATQSLHGRTHAEVQRALNEAIPALLPETAIRSDDAALARPYQSPNTDPADSSSVTPALTRAIIAGLMDRLYVNDGFSSNSCYYCHTENDNEFRVKFLPTDEIPEKMAARIVASDYPPMWRPMIPDSRWSFSFFTHNDHPPVNANGEPFIACHECHSVGESLDDTTGSTQSSDTIMRNMAICQACHTRETPTHDGAKLFGMGGIGSKASSDCRACHDFHSDMKTVDGTRSIRNLNPSGGGK